MRKTGEIPWREADINAILGEPTEAVCETLKGIDGDVIILGAGGKMGATTASMLRRGLDRVGKRSRVLAVSRFSSAKSREELERVGAEAIACDLSEWAAVQRLPECPNVFFMAGHKFGSSSSPELTWAMNTIVPGYVAEKFSRSRIVAFSTGCVYSFVPVDSGGSREGDPIEPIGDYANSCVGRERIFTYFSRRNGTPVSIYRLNYSVEVRYGVLVDIAQKVLQEEPVDVTTGYVNLIWQGDAVARAIQLIEHSDTPPFVLNVTGTETLSVRELAARFGERFGKTVKIRGKEERTAWLSDASRSLELFGPPSVSVDQMIAWVADYLEDGGELLGKPTYFEARTGKF